MIRLLCLAIGYLFGLFQTSYILGRVHGIDIREYGSHNAGTTNMLRTMGLKAGLLTFAGDCSKCILAVVLVRVIFGKTHADILPLLEFYAAAGTILGHNYPFYLGFRGGKGIAATAGLVLSVNWIMAICGIITFFTTFFVTHYVSLGSLLVYVGIVIEVIILGQNGFFHMTQPHLYELYAVAIFLAVLAFWKHRENIKRLLSGTGGTALAVLLNNNGHEVTIWSIIPEEVEMLRTKRQHEKKLPGVILAPNIDVTGDLEGAMTDKDIVVLAVPSPFTRSTAHSMRAFCKEGQKIVDVAKGVEEKTLMTLSQIIEEEIPQADVAVLSGPSHAEEVGKCIPTTCVVGAHSRETAEYLQNIFMSKVFRVYTTPDMLGMELGGALKNVIALAAGMADGLGYGDNTKAALITRGIAEIARLGIKMGGIPETFYGLTGIGDLIVTCASVHSRNRKAGYLIGQGKSMQEAMDEVGMIVEGVYSAKAAIRLAQKYQVELPIIEQVNKILFEDKKAADALNDLMLRDPKTESDAGAWK